MFDPVEASPPHYAINLRALTQWIEQTQGDWGAHSDWTEKEQGKSEPARKLDRTPRTERSRLGQAALLTKDDSSPPRSHVPFPFPVHPFSTLVGSEETLA
jgi:hypothetical protein